MHIWHVLNASVVSLLMWLLSCVAVEVGCGAVADLVCEVDFISTLKFTEKCCYCYFLLAACGGAGSCSWHVAVVPL